MNDKDHAKALSADAAIARLQVGNGAYLRSKRNVGDVSLQLRKRLASEGQHPYAVVVACSDSRVVPEHLFSAGLGQLFTIRVAGNVVDATQEASVAYAVSHLGVKLVLVLGHTGCGAVDAVLEGGSYGKVSAVTDLIHAAVGDEHDERTACILNVAAGVNRLRGDAELAALAEREGVRIEGALCHIDTGEVEWLW